MSYCRFSSDNWKCDIYMYEGNCGWTIHVATKKPIGDVPPLLPMPGVNHTREELNAFIESWHTQQRWLETCKYKSIELPSDGESFYNLPLDEAYEKLIELKGEGYWIPDDVLVAVKEELEENNNV